MSETARVTAERVVTRLLDDHASEEDFERRPGGPKDPMRQTTMKIPFKKKDFTGKRGAVGAAPPAKSPPGKYGGRMGWKPMGEAKAGKSPAEAWKQGKSASGQAVAKKPGKVSYKEALMARVLENIAKKKGLKGAGKTPGNNVAKPPGKVSYGKK